MTKIMKKRIIIGLSVIVIIVGLWLIGRAIFGSKKSYSIVAAQKGDVIQIVSATGTVTPAKQINLQFENAGKIKKIEVKVGDQVKAGQPLVRLDIAELIAQLQSAEAALDIAKAKLAQTLAGNRPEDVKIYEVAVVSAQIDLENKENELQDAKEEAERDLAQSYEDVMDTLNDAYLKADDALQKQMDDLFTDDNTSNPQLSFTTADSQAEKDAEWQRTLAGEEISQFQAEISQLDEDNREDLDGALTEGKQHLEVIRDFLNRVTDALNAAVLNANLTSTELTAYKTSANTGRTNVNAAITALTSQEQTIAAAKIDNQVAVSKAQTAADKAEAALKDAEAQLVLKKANPLQADVDLAQAQVKQARADMLGAQEKINKATLSAPIDGVITAVEKEEGEIAAVGSVIVSMINSNLFQVEANVSETEIAKIKLGNAAEMTLDALPNEKFSGKVIKIDPAETVVSGVIYYKITSVFDANDERIKSGMTVNLDVQTEKKEAVLYLPYYVVKSRDGEKYVSVLEKGAIKEKTIKTGLEGETNVEIIEGLQEGEQVVFGE
jgi:HlyD family secretion protein